MINSSIPVTIAGQTFPSVKACCEFFNISSSKVYKYKSANKCSAEEAIRAFLSDELAAQSEEAANEHAIEETPAAVEEEPVVEEPVVEEITEETPVVEEQPVEEHINEENESTEVNEEMEKNENNVMTVVAGNDNLTHVSKEERTLTLTTVKLNIFQRIKRWLFG